MLRKTPLPGLRWRPVCLSVLVTTLPASAGGIPGLSQAISPTVTSGTVVNIVGPPLVVVFSGSNPEGDSVASATPVMEARNGLGSFFEQLQPNWLTELNPTVSLAQIGSLIQQRYDAQVLNRIHAPAVTSITVEHMTLIYPAGYYFNAEPVVVHTRRLVLNSAGRQVTGYFLNYDKVADNGGAVIFQMNGHFGHQPSRIGIGLNERGGLMGAALGKIAMQGLPLITYDDHNVGESSNGVASNLPRTLENIVQMDTTLLTNFTAIDALGLSGGCERTFHFMALFQSNVRTAYCAGFFNPLWTQYTFIHNPGVGFFGANLDTYDETFFSNFQNSDLTLVGMSRGVSMAYANATHESGIDKYGFFVEMTPAMLMYTNHVESRGDDANGDGVPDYGIGLPHEYNLPDLFDWWGTPVQASRILYVDAVEPGPNPASLWEDLGLNGYAFSNTSAVAHNDMPGSADDSYSFDVGDRMDGVGDASPFDFDTDKALGFSMGMPFSINAYFRQDWAFDGFTGQILSKTDEPGDGQFTGWFFGGNPDASTRFDFFMQPGDNQNRMYARTDLLFFDPRGYSTQNVYRIVRDP